MGTWDEANFFKRYKNAGNYSPRKVLNDFISE